jgi:putative oxidoreductase
MSIDFALLLIRLIVGSALAAHGAQKLFGWFGDPGLKGTAGMFGQGLGMRHAGFWAFVGSVAEFAGGLLLAAGFLNPVGPLLLVGAMLVAIFKVHWSRGFWGTNGGYELPLVFLVVSLAIAFAGNGAYALDAAFGTALPEPAALVLGVGLAGLGAIAALVDARPAPTAVARPEGHAAPTDRAA